MQSVTITYLEMRSREALKAKPCADRRFCVREATIKQWQFNRFLYGLVGSNWSWTDKCNWTNQQWQDYAEADDLRTFVAYFDGSVAGYYELKLNSEKGTEIAIFGLAPKFVGRGYGGALLTHALEEAWRTRPERVWLHTCSLDHPHALRNYEARGLTIYKVETRALARKN